MTRASNGSRPRSAAGSRASPPCRRSCPDSACGGSGPPVGLASWPALPTVEPPGSASSPPSPAVPRAGSTKPLWRPRTAATSLTSRRRAGSPDGTCGRWSRGWVPLADPGPPEGAGDPLVEQAWDCGLHSRWVLGVRAGLLAAGFTEPTPELVLALAHTDADVAWVASTAHGVTDPSTAPWVAWTHTELDGREPSARRDWMATGARRVDIVSLSMSGYRRPGGASGR